MKQLLIILLLTCCVGPAFAQEKPLIKAGLEGISNLAGAVNRGVVTQTAGAAKVPVVRLAQLTNLPDQPRVRVRLWLTRNLPTIPEVLSARVFVGNDMPGQIFSDKWKKLYIPPILNEPEPALYRGMRLSNLEELKYVLTHGLETKKHVFQRYFFPVRWQMQ